ncbi:hypothetical protein BJV82DRAFT_613096 [Fennellomyces sp. T-0311]|nr:hypothetical protein BJV82DRAFT_613096 [Fennellomyces sp. T-0311]
MANSKQHGFISKTMGLSLGFVGIVGLVISLVSLLPVNGYNMYITVNALIELLKYELQNNTDWWSLSPNGYLYAIFLAGSILSSLITIVMVIATCLRQRPDNEQMGMTRQDIESNTKRRSVWLSRMGCLIFVGQIGWALFGTHVLFFLQDDLPESIHKATMISVLILWLNYLIVSIFSFILFCASFFIILGARRSSSQQPSNAQSSSSEEMQYRDESTPLLNAVRA